MCVFSQPFVIPTPRGRRSKEAPPQVAGIPSLVNFGLKAILLKTFEQCSTSLGLPNREVVDTLRGFYTLFNVATIIVLRPHCPKRGSRTPLFLWFRSDWRNITLCPVFVVVVTFICRSLIRTCYEVCSLGSMRPLSGATSRRLSPGVTTVLPR